ncbi:MAG: hypothetical protein KME28_28205 [Pelatocladus maniniholoensis HA4357-MV3]|jgi:hypothetical protein|uniref:Uncharacterized protein n=1 Tax=Pelatocladus maniniholoensis HA4357-MV3 TaxID=1117104 RepID=A0A9E3HDA5_9NOST|nr:hypothetical protein [Pelatocladus maniniholoensis HA4357-MV3]BAZ67282.1 hypothetical protein NIES4106_20370 [Fischerella sp. NIES-4106]
MLPTLSRNLLNAYAKIAKNLNLIEPRRRQEAKDSQSVRKSYYSQTVQVFL